MSPPGRSYTTSARRSGRSYQTPFADRIRNEAGIPTIAVGAISSHDDVNSILLAGRADLVAIGRPHLYDPAWTLHAAAEQGYTGPGVTWPQQYTAGNRRPQTGRTDGPKPACNSSATAPRTPATPAGTHRVQLPGPVRLPQKPAEQVATQVHSQAAGQRLAGSWRTGSSEAS